MTEKRKDLRVVESDDGAPHLKHLVVDDGDKQKVVAAFSTNAEAALYLRLLNNVDRSEKGLTLPISEADLRTLKAFAIGRAWFQVPVIGAYEVLRMRSPEGGTLIVYQGVRKGLRVVAGNAQPAARALIEEWADGGRQA